MSSYSFKEKLKEYMFDRTLQEFLSLQIQKLSFVFYIHRYK